MAKDKPTVLLEHYLKQLKLPTILREHKAMAAACAQAGPTRRWPTSRSRSRP